MNDKRSPGRPLGTGKPDDGHLSAVADLLVADPQKAPTRAMRERYWALADAGRIDPKWDGTEDAAVRRWQTKWKDKGARLLAEAHERRLAARQAASRPAATHRRPARDPLTGVPLSPGMAVFRDLMEKEQRLNDLIDPPHLRRLREVTMSLEIQAARAYIGSPEHRAAVEFLNSPARRLAEDDLKTARALGLFGTRPW